MSWLDQLRPASFRGVPFHVDTIDWTAGPNTVVREYPFQDLPCVFTLGQGAEEIRLSAYVIGDDYHEQRDALKSALDGAGLLMHPTAGILRVHVAGKFTIREAPTAEGGMARFDLAFVRTDAERLYPTAAPSTVGEARAAAGQCKAAAVEAFGSEWSLARQPGWVSEAVIGRLSGALDTFWPGLAGAAAGMAEFNANLVGTFQSLRGGLDRLVTTPRRLAEEVANLFELPGEIDAAGARAFQEAFRWVFTVSERVREVDFEVIAIPPGAGPVIYGTGVIGASESAARRQLRRLQAGTDRLIESLAVSAFVEATAAIELANVDEAMQLRATVHAQCSRLLSSASTDAAPSALTSTSWHDALAALHAAALRDLQARSQDLVRLSTYTPESWQPVWYISHRLYGTAAYADEILAMNPHITHPLLVPPGRPLRIVRH